MSDRLGQPSSEQPISRSLCMSPAPNLIKNLAYITEDYTNFLATINSFTKHMVGMEQLEDRGVHLDQGILKGGEEFVFINVVIEFRMYASFHAFAWLTK